MEDTIDYNKEMASNYQQMCPVIKKFPKLNPDEVTGMTEPYDKNLDDLFQFDQRGYLFIGMTVITDKKVLPEYEIKKLVGSMGGDFYIAYYNSEATIHSSRLELVGYTTPQLVTSSAQAVGTANYQGNRYDNDGYTQTSSGTVNASAIGSSQTLVGGASTYERVPYDFTPYSTTIDIMISPERKAQLIQQGYLSAQMADYYSFTSQIKRKKALH
jgi:hypothetical protein